MRGDRFQVQASPSRCSSQDLEPSGRATKARSLSTQARRFTPSRRRASTRECLGRKTGGFLFAWVHLRHLRAPGLDEVPGHPYQALAGRKRPPGLFACYTQRPAEQRGHTARQEEIELVPRAHLRLPGLLLVPFPLEPLPLPPPLPQLFALHACTVAEGSDYAGALSGPVRRAVAGSHPPLALMTGRPSPGLRCPASPSARAHP